MTFKQIIWRTLLGFFVLFLLYQLWIFLHICWWVNHNPASTAFMADRLEILQEKDPKAELQHKWVEYKKISPYLKRAIIASEDPKFTYHQGFDWDAIEYAYHRNMEKGKVVLGASTISQQLAKNLFLSSQRTPWRKVEEAIITVMLEATMTKRRMFEIYLNVIEWGNGVFGAEAAAQHYYHTSASNLSQQQAARMAAMVPGPRYFDAHRKSNYLARRTNTIIARMPPAKIP
ncbi:MAG TPA: monofunctional biosynthetic peptidoglycan transglycosylase [Methylophilaceae bacterium]|nr:monofunctional biosynthetic peptidoglycan transglycosylase [Methylophilaceae bacterium]